MQTQMFRAVGERGVSRRGLTGLIVDFGNFAKAPAHFKFPYSKKISKSVTSTRKVKGTNFKITVSFKTSLQKSQQRFRWDIVCVPR
jgi:hypothetical protein